MARYREALPQLSGRLFLTDGGVETTLIFRDGWTLPHFASFVLLASNEGVEGLRGYFRSYAQMARQYGVGCILESVTWRASADWGDRLGYSPESLAAANRQAIAMLHDIRDEFESGASPMVVSGCLGPRGDGYSPTKLMSDAEAQTYHAPQIEALRAAEADMLAAFTLNYPAEAIGITRGAMAAEIPVAISFTVETDGRLPTGETLRQAIELVDEATGGGPAYYMINCAHPTHFAAVLESEDAWTDRIRGLRANASTRSHAELNDATELDDGDPVDLGQRYRELRRQLRHLNVLGGCCGTDQRHIEEICKAWGPQAPST